MAKSWEITETLAYWYSSDSTQRELFYEYPQDLVRIIFIIFGIFVNRTKITLASEGLIHNVLEGELSGGFWSSVLLERFPRYSLC